MLKKTFIFTGPNNKDMKTLNLASDKTTLSTYNKIVSYVYENRNTLSNDMKLFYSTVAGMVHTELYKSSKRRTTMPELLERSYNIDELILRSGAASVETVFIKVK